eukprot:403339794
MLQNQTNSPQDFATKLLKYQEFKEIFFFGNRRQQKPSYEDIKDLNFIQGPFFLGLNRYMNQSNNSAAQKDFMFTLIKDLAIYAENCKELGLEQQKVIYQVVLDLTLIYHKIAGTNIQSNHNRFTKSCDDIDRRVSFDSFKEVLMQRNIFKPRGNSKNKQQQQQNPQQFNNQNRVKVLLGEELPSLTNLNPDFKLRNHILLNNLQIYAHQSQFFSLNEESKSQNSSLIRFEDNKLDVEIEESKQNINQTQLYQTNYSNFMISKLYYDQLSDKQLDNLKNLKINSQDFSYTTSEKLKSLAFDFDKKIPTNIVTIKLEKRFLIRK